MKKLLAALLALAMLLGACACAEGAQVTVRDIGIYRGDDLLYDLGGLELVFNSAEYEGASGDVGFRLSCSANGRALATLVLAGVGDAIVAGYGNGGEATELYSMTILTNGAASEVAPAAGIDPDASFFGVICDAVPEEWKSDSGAVEYEGESCRCTTFAAPRELLAQAVRQVADALESIPQFSLFVGRMGAADIFRSAVEELAGSVRFGGALYDGESADYIEASLDFGVDGKSIQLGATVRCEPIERGDLLSVALRLGDGDADFGVSFDFEGVETDDEAWLEQLDVDGATELDAVLAGQEDPQPLLEKLQSDAAAIFGTMAAGVSNVIFTNQLKAFAAGSES